MDDIHTEIWLLVPGDSRYEVSNLGRLRNYETKHVKAICVNENGYGIVKLGRHANARIHVLVAEAFIGPKPKGKDVNHKDGVKMNNRADNLEYLTRSENHRHAFRLGLSKSPFTGRFGDRHYNVKISDADVRLLRELHIQGTSRRSLATRFGLSYYTVWDITTGRSRTGKSRSR